MPEFHDRRDSSVIRLEPLDHPHLQDTYHASEADAHEAANTQSANHGGFKYNVHKDGKKVQASKLAYAKERTANAVAYNKSKKGE